MATLTRVAGAFTVLMLVAGLTGAFAVTPGPSDFDACNRDAADTSSPSASPNLGGGARGSARAGNRPSLHGGVRANPSGPVTSASASGSPGTNPSVSGDLSSGMSPDVRKDPGAQQAYFDCMKRRGF